MHVVQLITLHPENPWSLASFKSRLVFALMVLAYPGCHGKEAIKQKPQLAGQLLVGTSTCLHMSWK